MKKTEKQKKINGPIYWLLLMAILFMLPSAMYAQQISITGSVKDSGGESLIGVSVKAGGSQIGTITDLDGRYSIQAPSDGELVFSYIGMDTHTEKIAGRTVIDVTLNNNAIMLDNVVVTALGIKREEKALGYAVQKLGGDAIQTVKGLNVGTSLSGKVAGLRVLNSSEFASTPDISIRGENPILVVDGVPYNNLKLSDISADDIENISVLKGATASALYGERGGGGAIMVTTKKGSGKSGMSISLNSSTMFTAGHLAIPETQSTFGRGTSGKFSQTADRVWGQVMDGSMIEQWNPVSKTMEEMPYLPIGKNNFKNFLQQGFVTNNYLSVAQEGELGNLRASANWTQNKGEYPNSRINKYSFSLGGYMKYEKFSLSSSMTYTKHDSPNAGFNGYKNYDPMYSLLVWSGADYDVRQYKDYWVIRDEFQNNPYNSYDANGVLKANGSLDNPYFQQHERTRSLNRDVFNGMFNAGYEIAPWIKANLRVGMDYYTDGQDVKISMGNLTSSGEDYGWSPAKLGHFAKRESSGYSINSEFMLSGDRTFDQVTVEYLAGGSISYSKDKTLQGNTVGGLSIPGFFSLKGSKDTPTSSSTLFTKQTNSLYARLGGSWRNMLYVEGTLRNDWSSTLPEDNRSYLYPSVAGSFIISELMPEVNWLSLWKVRGSWTVSKTTPTIYQNNMAYSIATNVWGSLPSASWPTTIRNTNISPAANETFEVGTMVNFLNNRLSLDFAYYNKRNYNRIIEAAVSQASGFNRNFINTDEEISTRGFEWTFRGTPIKTKDMQLDISTNWTRYARYYTKIDEEFSADKPWIEKGKRVDHYVLRDFQYSPQGQLIHNNGIPLYSGYDTVYGYTDPDWIWGLGFNFRYKRVSVNLAFDGRIGGMTPTITEAYMWIAGSHPNTVVPERFRDSEEEVAGNKDYKGIFVGNGVKVVSGEATYDTYGNILTDTRVFAPNDVSVKYKAYIDGTHKNFIWGGAASPLDSYSTTFFKLREISITYDIPSHIASKFWSKGGSISLVGQNVLLWAKDFKYSDPDGGTENLSDPSPRYIGFNLNLNF